MKDYRNFPKEFLGASDSGRLTMKSNGESTPLLFGEDGRYRAYFIRGEDVAIGGHYKKVAEFSNEVQFFDDDGPSKKFTADKIIIYRAGEFGCIVQLI